MSRGSSPEARRRLGAQVVSRVATALLLLFCAGCDGAHDSMTNDVCAECPTLLPSDASCSPCRETQAPDAIASTDACGSLVEAAWPRRFPGQKSILRDAVVAGHDATWLTGTFIDWVDLGCGHRYEGGAGYIAKLSADGALEVGIHLVSDPWAIGYTQLLSDGADGLTFVSAISRPVEIGSQTVAPPSGAVAAILLLQLSPGNGEITGVKTFGASERLSGLTAALSTDALFLAGTFHGSLDFGPVGTLVTHEEPSTSSSPGEPSVPPGSFFVAKLTRAGEPVWARDFHHGAVEEGQVPVVTVGAGGDAIVMMPPYEYQGTNVEPTMPTCPSAATRSIIKLDPAGGCKRVYALDVPTYNRPRVLPLADGSILYAHSVDPLPPSPDGGVRDGYAWEPEIVKLAADGSVLWTQRYNVNSGPAQYSDSIWGLLPLTDDRFVLIGQAYRIAGPWNPDTEEQFHGTYLLGFDRGGSELWQQAGAGWLNVVAFRAPDTIVLGGNIDSDDDILGVGPVTVPPGERVTVVTMFPLPDGS
jgi:hypothetical protein